MSKFYISEENLGSEAAKEQAEFIIQILVDYGFDVEYGSSLNNQVNSEEEQVSFDSNFELALFALPENLYPGQQEIGR